MRIGTDPTAKSSGEAWTAEQDQQLRDLAMEASSVRQIAFRLARSQEAIRARARLLRVKLPSQPRRKYVRLEASYNDA